MKCTTKIYLFIWLIRMYAASHSSLPDICICDERMCHSNLCSMLARTRGFACMEQPFRHRTPEMQHACSWAHMRRGAPHSSPEALSNCCVHAQRLEQCGQRPQWCTEACVPTPGRVTRLTTSALTRHRARLHVPHDVWHLQTMAIVTQTKYGPLLRRNLRLKHECHITPHAAGCI